mmetsp:Transcript_59635/g.158718  ORF Transcript_59635/g.158718 Transcript_59635/m.158718 type:complete len:330 (-) Transcript_59635:118-1107(-)
MKDGDFFGECWQRCNLGFRGIWNNWKAARSIRARMRRGESISLSDAISLQRGRADNSKILQLLALCYAGGFPYVFFWMPLPSTFDLPRHQDHKLKQATFRRISGVVQCALDIERSDIEMKKSGSFNLANLFGKRVESPNSAKTIHHKVLTATSWLSALEPGFPALMFNSSALSKAAKRKVDLSGLSPPFVKAFHVCARGGFEFLPAFVLKFHVKSHLKQILEFDEHVRTLGTHSLSSLSREELEFVCTDRFVGGWGQSKDQLADAARRWYTRLEAAEKAAHAQAPMAVCPYRLRLALLGLNALESARAQAGTGEVVRSVFLGSDAGRAW